MSIVIDSEIPVSLLTPKHIDKSLIDWLKESRNDFEKCLYKTGGVLFRGFGFKAISEFNQIAQHISPNLLDYVYRSSPRTHLGGKIFSSTEYPSDQTIPLHCENSYSNSWPTLIMFFSVIVAEAGGQTPLANMHKVYLRIPKTIRDKFRDKKILYVRNYHPGIDLNWETVFQTKDKAVVEKYCKENNIEFEWQGNDVLQTRQICQAVIEHPHLKLPIWFNQAHLFHVNSLPAETQKFFYKQFPNGDFPRNTYYGDGEPIDFKTLDIIHHAYLEEKKIFNWHRGDILVLDNCLMAHGREPFTGDRKVVVAMA